MRLSLTIASLGLATAALAQRPIEPAPNSPHNPDVDIRELDDGTIVASSALSGTHAFLSWGEYFQSRFFLENDMRCGQEWVLQPNDGTTPAGSGSDCSFSNTSIETQYAPLQGKYCIPVVVHVIEHSNGSGALTNAMVESQIDILNEDFLAIAGTNGAPGTDCQIEFYLATQDPQGNATNGITRTVNNTWYNDGGNFMSALNWDTCRYLNIYTNTASGFLGYATLPNGGGVACTSGDGVVCNWTAFGRNAVGGAPYNQGRTCTHEVGHYLGLFHTFDGGCGTSSCYNTGDLICDTNQESSPEYNCPGSSSSCGSQDPVHNYMDYSTDLCMWEFTPEQANRMRCTLENWRPQLGEPCGGGTNVLFSDDFESGGFGQWVISSAARLKVKQHSAFSGTWGAKLKKGGVGTGACTIGTDETWMISDSFSTVGFASVTVDMDSHFRKQEIGCEFMDCQYSANGGAWVSFGIVETHAWDHYTFNLPAGAGNQADLRLRFITNAKGLQERAEIDNLVVSGN